MLASHLRRRYGLLVVFAVACSGSDSTTPTTPSTRPVASVSVTVQASSLIPGGTTVAVAVLRDAFGVPLIGRSTTWTSSASAVVLVSSFGVVTAVAPGTATISATSEGVTGSASLTVVPAPTGQVATIALSPSNLVVAAGSERILSARVEDSAGNAVAATLTWATSNASVATVDATGKVTAVVAGTADVTASSGLVQSNTVSVAVTDNTPWPTVGASAGSLIEAAVKLGTLTAEQGLLYRVFAAFSDSRLPVQFRGIADNTPDNPVLQEAADQYDALSAATKAQLAPFFVPPAYAGSWYEARVPATASAGVASLGTNSGAAQASAGTCIFLPWHRSVETAHFKIHYDVLGGPFDQLASLSVTVVAAEAEKIWDTETAAFGRTPLTDATVTNQCNGGDGKLDIYVSNMVLFSLANGLSTRAKVVPYVLGTCAMTPSAIILSGDGDARAIRNSLAHEFFHVLELGSYNRAANCFKEYYWLGEATANWAMDLVYGNPQDQYEQPWAGRYMDSERLVPLDQAFGGDADKTNGYCDYVFLLYLARKYNNNVIREIWDASESANSVAAVVNALASHGGIRNIWPEFALATWNDFGGNNQKDFNTWDGLQWGVKGAFDRKDAGDQFGNPSIPVDQKGASRQSFEALTSAPAAGAGRELPRLTIHADYFKFTDGDVASVLYTNGLALADFPDLKIQAMVKLGGAWKPAEDWTREGTKSFCRDLKAERVEELVLIYSNSDGDKAGLPIPFPFLPRLNVSNVGCATWQGTASINTVVPGPVGGSSESSVSNLVFERQRFPQLPDGAPGMEIFTNTSGLVNGSSITPCITSSVNGLTSALDGSLEIHLDNLIIGNIGPPPDRDVVQGVGASSLSTNFVHCILGASTSDQVWSWFEIPVPGHTVSADGRTIEGNVVQSGGPLGTTTTLIWKLTAVREP